MTTDRFPHVADGAAGNDRNRSADPELPDVIGFGDGVVHVKARQGPVTRCADRLCRCPRGRDPRGPALPGKHSRRSGPLLKRGLEAVDTGLGDGHVLLRRAGADRDATDHLAVDLNRIWAMSGFAKLFRSVGLLNCCRQCENDSKCPKLLCPKLPGKFLGKRYTQTRIFRICRTNKRNPLGLH